MAISVLLLFFTGCEADSDSLGATIHKDGSVSFDVENEETLDFYDCAAAYLKGERLEKKSGMLGNIDFGKAKIPNAFKGSVAGRFTRDENVGQEPPSIKVEAEKTGVSIAMVGDVLLHEPIEIRCRKNDGSYDFSRIFKNTRDEIENADLALVNQEVIIGGKELKVSGYPNFNAPFEIADELAESGFDVICHGTNHALDRSGKGIRNCLNYWKDNYPDIHILGIADSKEKSEEICVVEVEGIRIAILNYTYGTNGVALPKDMPYGVKLLKENIVREELTKAEEIADFTIVCPHWGTEYSLSVSKEQKKWNELFFELGADLVIGTHPHVIEPVEWTVDEEKGRKMLTYYSLGNYVNWTSDEGENILYRMVGAMAKVTLDRDAEGDVYISNYSVEPLVCHLGEKKEGICVYPLSDYSEELANSNLIKKQVPSFTMEKCKELCDEVFGDLWH